jgi:hypothetical protein
VVNTHIAIAPLFARQSMIRWSPPLFCLACVPHVYTSVVHACRTYKLTQTDEWKWKKKKFTSVPAA